MRLRYVLLVLVLVTAAAVAWATQPFNTSGRWACYSGTCIIGSAQAPAIQILTDSTGDGELDVPDGSIATAEVLDDTLTPADMADTLVLDAQLGITSGAAEGIAMTHAMTDDTDEIAHLLTVTASDTGSATTAQYGIKIDNAASTEGLDALLVLDNSDADDAVAAGVLFDVAAGTMTTAVDASDAQITNAINIGSNVILGGDETMTIGATDDAVEVTRNDAGAVLYTCADDDADADCNFAGGGAGKAILGDSGNASAEITTDGGTVTVDGYVQGIMGPITALASGALTINSIHLATAAADYDIPDTNCDAAADVGKWVTVIVQDKNEVISVTSDDASNLINIPGTDNGAGDEIDSSGDANNGAGEHITLVCGKAENWYATSMGGTWADGGGAD